MCTCILAGRSATQSGVTILGANNDWAGVSGILTRRNGGLHAPGELRVLTGGKQVPQPEETYGYSFTSCSYSIGTLDRGWAGGVNDRQVAIAGTGASAFKPISCPDGWLEPDDVPLLILERASTAREGIRLVGSLIEKYGFHASAMEGCESMCTFGVADPRECWWLEMAPGNHWVAVRVPDDCVSVRENAYGIHDADLTDSENVLASRGLADYAREQGWWNGDDRHFDFANVYGSPVSPNEWGPELDPMNMRRRWRATMLLSGQEGPEDQPMYTVRPAHKLGLDDIKTVLRDSYEGTVYDLSKAPGAGQYADPFHDDPPSYSICRDWTAASIVTEFRPEGRGTLWTCLANPRIGFYFPVSTGIDSLPPACECPVPDGETPSLFWDFKKLGILTQRRYSRYIPRVTEVQRDFEAEAARQDAAALSPEARQEMTDREICRAAEVCEKLRTELLYQY